MLWGKHRFSSWTVNGCYLVQLFGFNVGGPAGKYQSLPKRSEPGLSLKTGPTVLFSDIYLSRNAPLASDSIKSTRLCGVLMSSEC